MSSTPSNMSECEYCGKVYKRLKLHQRRCPKRQIKSHQFLIETKDADAFAHVLSFLSNQSIVKLQCASGARYEAASADASSICCPCENDELAIANGLCLVCNHANDPSFADWISGEEASTLYGLEIDPKPYRVYGHRSLKDFAIGVIGSKQAWLNQIAPTILRRRKALRALQKQLR